MPYSSDPIRLLENSLSPLEAKKITLSHDRKTVFVIVEDEQYPTVLGKRGMNARLNGELIGLELQVQKWSDYQAAMKVERDQMVSEDNPELDEALHIEGMSPLIVESLISAGFDTLRKVLSATPQDLATIPEISLDMADNILEQIRKKRM
jgi:N utilization substance protein A